MVFAHDGGNNGNGASPAAAASPPALVVRGLWKKFGDTIAVADLSLEVPRGSIFALVGPNGAGKTTMLNMATGLLRPDAGEAYICGYDIWRDPLNAKAVMGLMADGLPVFDRLTGFEYLEYVGVLRSMVHDDVVARATDLLSALSLSEASNVQIVDYSAGMTKKILLAGALIHNPQILILDEPLSAVDPVSARVIIQILRAYARSGNSVVISSHVMEQVEDLCDHVAIIHNGSVRLVGATKDLVKDQSLNDLFFATVGGRELDSGDLEWLNTAAPPEPERPSGPDLPEGAV